jgi:acyl carrier protein
MTTLDRVIDLLREAAGLAADESVDAETGLIGSGLSLDSVAALELVVAVENEFGIELPQEQLVDLHALRTVGTLVGLIERKQRGEC